MSDVKIYLYILVMAAVTYAIRALPLTLFRKEIKNVTIRSFLYYVPYVTLAVMTFPAILTATGSMWSGGAGFIAAVLIALRRGSLFQVSAGACIVVFVCEWLMGFAG
ncbi:MAG: AzlD domain-containing protein [Lachnospiraceae bacterium]|jgi:branched-subunit amino acid transport protein|nr:AzlD domain-containing protein [Lachnospiraceae bacterium]